MKPILLQKTKFTSNSILICLCLVFFHSTLFSQDIVSYEFGEYTPTISDPNVTATNLTEGSGIAFYDCGGTYVYASGFDQRNVTDAFNNGDYWEFSVTPNSGYAMTISYFEVNQRASNHLFSSEPANTLGTIYWKIGSGNWIPSDIVAGVQHSVVPFCTSTSTRRPHFPDITTTETVTFRLLRWIYDDGSPGPYNRETRNGRVWIEGVSALPVELAKFEAKQEKREVLLAWETASEKENLGFEIEQSADGNEWRTIGFEEGHGTTSETIQYSFADKTPQNGDNYYRLKQIDFDGNYNYSMVRHVLFDREDSGFLNVFPNPIKDHFTLGVMNPEGKRAEVILFSSTGQVVWKQSFSSGEMGDYWQKEFSLPQREMYFVVTQIGQVLETRKIVALE